MYEPFGEPKAAGKLLLNRHKEELLHVPFGFTGEAHDFYSGLIYLRARYYDPGVGSFISRDSYLGNLLRPLSQNRYTYVENNPINYIDPSGHERYITTLQQLTPNLSLKDRIAAFAFAVDDVLFRGFAQKLTGVNVKDAAICENSDELQIAYETNKESLQATLIFMGMMDSTNELDLVEKAPQGAGKGFNTFNDAKKFLGSPGQGNQWHHIVEQSQISKSGFSPTQIQNTNNLIAVDSATHAKISGYYSSKQAFTGGKTVRDWLAGQSYEKQFEFGMQKLRDFGVIK